MFGVCSCYARSFNFLTLFFHGGQTELSGAMAKCEEGYLCEVCGKEVEEITDSDLYLRYVIGMIDPETLHTTKERHIRCNPTLGQFIVDERFEPLVASGDFSKHRLDQLFVEQQEQLVTRGWRRLQEVAQSELPITEYPLPEVRARYS